MPGTRVVVHDREVDRLLAEPAVGDLLMDVAHPIVADARAGAPHLTGAGAASIHAEEVLDGDGWSAWIGWDREHFYMRFHELGTRTLPARPFLVPAVEGATR